MKIRIKGNAVRFRLTRSDVTQLYNQRTIVEHTAFPGTTFRYGIKVTSGDTDQVSCSFDGSAIIIGMTPAMINELYTTERVGYSEQIGQINLLVEKDFVCLDEVDEDQSDNYPNPSANQNK